MDDVVAFARLVEALRPWLNHLVIVGGWAHRLYRFHERAISPPYKPPNITDVVREAARLPQGRTLTPERVQAACAYGLDEIFRT